MKAHSNTADVYILYLSTPEISLPQSETLRTSPVCMSRLKYSFKLENLLQLFPAREKSGRENRDTSTPSLSVLLHWLLSNHQVINSRAHMNTEKLPFAFVMPKKKEGRKIDFRSTQGNNVLIWGNIFLFRKWLRPWLLFHDDQKRFRLVHVPVKIASCKESSRSMNLRHLTSF